MAQAIHVLVVDNDEESRTVMQSALEMCGCRVTTACQGIEAADFFMKEPGITFVISDLNMGERGQDGNDLFHKIRGELGQRGARFALMTGSNQNSVMTELASHGAVILKKPVELAQLETLMRI